jgi:hypothetical protein
MPMDVTQCKSSLISSLMKYPCHTMFSNPLIVAVIITGVILLILECTHDSSHKTRTAFWVFSTVTLGVFINNQFIIKEYRDMAMSETERTLVGFVGAGPPSAILDAPIDYENDGGGLVVEL